MKEVILSADSESTVYSVPDAVADDLRGYCIEFCDSWLHNSPDAEKYRRGGCVCYTEADFIAYLNQYVFPQEKSVKVKNLGWIGQRSELPAEYAGCPYFNF